MANDYTSIYNIKDFILNGITPKYFNTQDISLANTGLYGMISDISATVAEDTMKVASRYITELIPGQSKLPDFIYANAANYGISDIFATCSKCKATLFIKEKDVLQHGVQDGRYTEYTIDSDLIVYIDGVPFSIPADIKIRSNYYNGKYNHRCYWDSSLKNSAVIDELPYIKCAKTHVANEKEVYIAMAVTLYQYVRKHTTEPIISNTTLNIPYVDVSFEDALCNIEAVYTSNDGVSTQLTKLLTRSAPITTPFIYYAMNGEASVRLSFSNDDRYFIPEYDSELDIYMYETLGDKGNFPIYNGENIYVSPKSDNPDLAYNNDIPIYCAMTSDANMGKNAYTLDEIKTLTAQYQITVNSITTDNDLDVYFGSYTSLYDTRAKFIKIRDDFANRIYSCYTRLKDSDNIYPTNTVDLSITLDKLDTPYDSSENKIKIPAGTRIGYLGDSINDCEVLSDEEPQREIEYATIGLSVIDKAQTTVALYMNSVNKTVSLSYSYVNDDSLFQFIAKSLTVERNALIGDNTYTFTLVIASTDLTAVTTGDDEDEYAGDEEVPTEQGDMELNIDKLKVFIYIETNGGHYLELEYVPGEETENTVGYTFRGCMTTDDTMNSSNIKLSGLTYCPNQHVQDCYTAMQDPPIKILVAYDEGMNPGHDYTNLIPKIETFTLCNIFECKEGELYFAYPMELIRPVLEFKPTEGEYSFYMSILDMPVVGKDFLLSDNHLQEFLKRLNSQHEFLQNLNIISNYAVIMRFFNTYGRSRIFTVTNGGLLNRVNCNISLSIKFFNGVEIEDYLPDIKRVIKEYIESVNYLSNSTGVNDIKLSVLSKTIHEEFSTQIDYIVMGSINGYSTDIQTIIMDKDLNAKENLDLLPEFLTIDIKDIEITVL